MSIFFFVLTCIVWMFYNISIYLKYVNFLKDCIEHEKLTYIIVTMKLSFYLQIISLKRKVYFFSFMSKWRSIKTFLFIVFFLVNHLYASLFDFPHIIFGKMLFNKNSDKCHESSQGAVCIQHIANTIRRTLTIQEGTPCPLFN